MSGLEDLSDELSNERRMDHLFMLNQWRMRKAPSYCDELSTIREQLWQSRSTN